jgi:hypothetical protein
VSEPDGTGYGDSPDTSNGAVREPQHDGAPAGDSPLTTDDEAQREDSVTRPGNEPD